MTRSKGNIMVYQISSSRPFKLFIFVDSLPSPSEEIKKGSRGARPHVMYSLNISKT